MSNQELLAIHIASMVLLIRSNAPQWAYYAAKNAAHYGRLILDDKGSNHAN